MKKFWVPGLIASTWTTYVLWGGNTTVESVLAAFGPSFLLASWLAGQVFRVRKQASVENSLQTLAGRITGLVDKLEGETRELLNHMTGGESYCYMGVMANNGKCIVIHSGEYHVQNLSARVCDIDLSSELPGWTQAANAHLFIGTLFKGMANDCRIQPLTGQRCRFSIFFTANNGSFIQELRLCKLEHGGWAHATRVRRDFDSEQPTVLYEWVDPDFLLEADGTVRYQSFPK